MNAKNTTFLDPFASLTVRRFDEEATCRLWRLKFTWLWCLGPLLIISNTKKKRHDLCVQAKRPWFFATERTFLFSSFWRLHLQEWRFAEVVVRCCWTTKIQYLCVKTGATAKNAHTQSPKRLLVWPSYLAFYLVRASYHLYLLAWPRKMPIDIF